MTSKSRLKFLILSIIVLIFISVKYIGIINSYKKARFELNCNNWTRTMPPFHSSTDTIEFIVDRNKDVTLRLWWQGLSGKVEITLTDEKNQKLLISNKKQETLVKKLKLDEGNYKLKVSQKRFTGGIAIGFDNVIIKNELDIKHYTLISSNPNKGFYWEYILYIPDTIKHNKILVVPNNSGIVSDNYLLHKERAKSLAQYKSDLAKELGVPMIVPIFPRTEGLYTHSLDRNSIFTKAKELKRIDMQLIQMIKDSKEVLSKKNIQVEEKILMSGFSASGNFVDRFSFLHPEMIEAVSFGGSNNIVPLESLNGVKLPYPIGIYDYKEITGKNFDLDLVSKISRYIYKGSEDKGGWQIVDTDGESIRYPWQEYYEKYRIPALIKNSINTNELISKNADLSEVDLESILFKAFRGKILIDRFNEVSSIYSKLGMEKSEFHIYKDVEHTINDSIKHDELEFFQNIIN